MNTLQTDTTSTGSLKIVHADEGRAWWIMNDHQLHKLGAADTRGRLSVWIESFGPGEGPPAHIHEREDEIFYVLEGEVTFYDTRNEYPLQADACVFAPRGRMHRFCNTGVTRARMLVITTPGGIEDFFEASSFINGDSTQRTEPGEEDVNRFFRNAADHGLTLFPPQ